MYLTKQKKAHRKEKINSAKTFEILEENVAYGVEQNITSYRDTEKKAVYFVGTQVWRLRQEIWEHISAKS